MLPSTEAGIDPPVDLLYQRDEWPDTPVAQALLDSARETYVLLSDAVDEERMVYIAGYGHPTVDGVELKDGRFRFHRSGAGDGIVPHSLGLLAGVPTY